VKSNLDQVLAGTLLSDALVDALAPSGSSSLDLSVPAHVWEAALYGPAAAMLDRPGKDVRARLVKAGWMLGGGAAGTCPEAITRVIEILHAGSLIVDDVQDGSLERRGGPALHCMVGVPLAINTGNWMYFWALTELTRTELPGACERAIATLVRCHQGQALDLATRIVDLEMREVPAVVAATTRLKTGALCRLATELGALAAGAPDWAVTAIGTLGEGAGIALQMLDDLGCLIAEDRRPKACEDLALGRPTWAWAWLAEAGDPFAWARACTDQRHLATAVDGDAAQLAFAASLGAQVERRGRAAVRETIDAALAAVPATRARDAVAAQLRAMEAMYG
jgi:geranylgeranyl pyrophosphate synthase